MNPGGPRPGPRRSERITGVVLGLVVVSLVWMIARALGMPPFFSEQWEVGGTTALYLVALGCVCDVAWRSTGGRRG
jgi:hypothetical protein